MVSRARGTVGERRGKCESGWERIEGAREKKIGALRSPDHNITPLLERHFHVTSQ